MARRSGSGRTRPHPYRRNGSHTCVERIARKSRDDRESSSSSSPNPLPSVSTTSDSDSEGHIARETKQIRDRFSIKGQLGKGTFGRVFEAWDSKRERSVALKIIRSVRRYREDALVEAQILWDLQTDRKSCLYCAQILRQFDWGDHLCLVFEKLGMSLRKFIRRQRDKGTISMKKLADISRGLCEALEFIHAKKLTHSDLKTDNVLFGSDEMVFDDSLDIRIKLIDFGAATWEQDKHAEVIQTRHYRAPEVVMDVGWSYPADMWSVGCIILELFDAKMTFDTHDSGEHLAMMERVVGKRIPGHMVQRAGASAASFFDRRGHLRWPDMAGSSKSERRVSKLVRLEDRVADQVLLGFIQGLLKIDPNERLTAAEALRHPFLASSKTATG